MKYVWGSFTSLKENDKVMIDQYFQDNVVGTVVKVSSNTLKVKYLTKCNEGKDEVEVIKTFNRRNGKEWGSVKKVCPSCLRLIKE